jgi:hypothetical protein
VRQLWPWPTAMEANGGEWQVSEGMSELVCGLCMVGDSWPRHTRSITRERACREPHQMQRTHIQER